MCWEQPLCPSAFPQLFPLKPKFLLTWVYTTSDEHDWKIVLSHVDRCNILRRTYTSQEFTPQLKMSADDTVAHSCSPKRALTSIDFLFQPATPFPYSNADLCCLIHLENGSYWENLPSLCLIWWEKSSPWLISSLLFWWMIHVLWKVHFHSLFFF